MDQAEIRRERLREWFAVRSVPPREKSYISQLLSGKASFGERAARRLEREYGMGDRYLDSAPSAASAEERRRAAPQTAAEIANRIASMDLSARDIEFLSRAIDLIAMERRRDPYSRPPSDYIGPRFTVPEPEYPSLAEQAAKDAATDKQRKSG